MYSLSIQSDAVVVAMCMQRSLNFIKKLFEWRSQIHNASGSSSKRMLTNKHNKNLQVRTRIESANSWNIEYSEYSEQRHGIGASNMHCVRTKTIHRWWYRPFFYIDRVTDTSHSRYIGRNRETHARTFMLWYTSRQCLFGACELSPLSRHWHTHAHAGTLFAC